MPLWEGKKELILVAGGFLFLYLIAYLFIIGPNYSDVERISAQRENKLGKEKEEFFTEGISLDFLIKEYLRINKELEATLEYLTDYAVRPFTENILPEDRVPRRHAYVRETYEKTQNDIRFAAGNYRVKLKEDVFSLGIELPEEYTESVNQDRVWLSQMEVSRQIIMLFLRIDEACGKLPGIVQINTIKPDEPRSADTNPEFLKVYPVEISFFANVSGIMRILHTVSQKKNFYVLQDIEIVSEPGNRVMLKNENTPEPLGDKGFRISVSNEFYYRVRMKLARLEALEEVKEMKEEKKVEEKVYKPIAY